EHPASQWPPFSRPRRRRPLPAGRRPAAPGASPTPQGRPRVPRSTRPPPLPPPRTHPGLRLPAAPPRGTAPAGGVVARGTPAAGRLPAGNIRPPSGGPSPVRAVGGLFRQAAAPPPRGRRRHRRATQESRAVRGHLRRTARCLGEVAPGRGVRRLPACPEPLVRAAVGLGGPGAAAGPAGLRAAALRRPVRGALAERRRRIRRRGGAGGGHGRGVLRGASRGGR